MGHLLEVKDLKVTFALRFGDLTAIDGVSFTLDRKEKLGLVGESGAGKSVTGFSIINLISKPGFISEGKVIFEGLELQSLSDKDIRSIRGNRISMIFQDPMMTLNPVLTIGTQMIETVMAHKKVSKKEAAEIALEKLNKVYIPSPEKRLQQYPHECSGGMRQRIVIAIALLTDPSLIIADEPTTALDVTIQSQILRLIKDMQKEYGMGIIFITHDLGVIAEVSDEVAVMYAGKVVEQASVFDIFKKPMHPYTKGLLSSIPRIDHPSKTALSTIEGMVPDLFHLPKGCRFENRCDYSTDTCKEISPDLEPRGENHLVSCIYKGDL